MSGPVLPFLGDKLTFNISLRRSQSEGYLYGVREHSPSDFAYFPPSGDWYIQMSGDSSYVPMNPSESSNFLSKITWRVSPRLKISTQSIISSSQSKSYSHVYKYNPDGTYNYKSLNRNTSIKINQALKNSFFTINFFHNTTDYKHYVYEAPYDTRYVSTSLIRGTPPSPSFSFGGTQMGHSKRVSFSNGGKIDITIMNIKRHDVKIGFSGRIDDLEEDAFTILYDEFNYPTPTVLEANESPSHSAYNKTAIFYSAYIQDKIEYENMVINGLAANNFKLVF